MSAVRYGLSAASIDVSVDVPIGGSLGALKKLEEKLGIDLTSGWKSTEISPSKL